MKNKIKYFVLYPLMLLVVILTFTYDVKELISLGQRIPFGSSYWKDSLSDAISTNKSIKLGTGDSLYYNGVVVTSGTGGGGIAASDNTTFTGINTFTDSLRANGYSIIDDAKITSYLRVTGEVTTDLNFNKGSSTSIGTISTDSLAFITNNTKRIVIDKYGYTVFTDTVQMLDRVYITGNLNVASNIYTLGNITADSIAGIGAFITDVNAVTLKGQDTTKFARTDTLTTERVKSKVEFSDVVTFFVSPVFSALVTFANGITVTGTATFNGDLVPTWVKNNSSVSAYQYEKTKIVGFKTGATTATTYTAAHGITDWHSIKSYTVAIMDDSSNTLLLPNVLSDDAGSLGKLYNNANVDSLNCRIRLVAAAVNLVNDSVFFRIVYTDFNR